VDLWSWQKEKEKKNVLKNTDIQNAAAAAVKVKVEMEVGLGFVCTWFPVPACLYKFPFSRGSYPTACLPAFLCLRPFGQLVGLLFFAPITSMLLMVMMM